MKPSTRAAIAFTLGLAAFSGATGAHHSIAGIYDSRRQATIEGVVAVFEFVNPHPFITIEVTADDGTTARWRLEMDNRWELAELGFRADTLEPGDRIVVTGSLARKEPNGLYVRRLVRPADGFTYEHHR
jgi:hypothetical protein